MTEKIERMELDADSKDKVYTMSRSIIPMSFYRVQIAQILTSIDVCEQQLMEIQELYNSQQLLTAELSDKLEKTEVKDDKRWLCSFFFPNFSDLVLELNSWHL